MIDRRATLLFLLFLLAAAPALAGSAVVSRVASSETIHSPQNAIASVEASADDLNGRSERVKFGLSSESSPVDADTSDGEASTNGNGEKNLANVLFVFIAIAVVFEAAMSAIFDWRVFIRYFEGRGVKTPVLVGVALLVTFTYDLDVLHQILQALSRDSDPTDPGKLITAFLISGGSSAVFQVYSNLGIRNPAERARKAEAEREKMAENEAAKSDVEADS